MATINHSSGRFFRALAIFWCSFFLSLHAIAQPSKKAQMDSLIGQLANTKEDTAKVNLLCAIARKCPDYDPNKGLEFAKQAIALSEKVPFEKGIATSNICAGLNEMSRTEYRSAQNYYKSALAKAREIEDVKLEGFALKDLGICNYEQNNIPESLNSFFTALRIAEETHNRAEIYVILEYIGHAYEAQKIFDKALQYYKRSYDSAVAGGEVKAKGKNLLDLGQVYQLTSRNSDALACYKEALVAFRQLKDENGIAFCNAGMGATYNELHQYGEALKKNKEALVFYTEHSDRINMAATLGNIGKAYVAINADTFGTVLPESLTNRKKNLDSAFYYLNKSGRLCRELSYLEGLCNIYSYLSLAWEQNGNYSEALKSYRSFINMRDSIYSADDNLKITNLEINREVEMKDKELQLKQLELAKKRSENLFFVSGMVLLLIVTIILYTSFSTQKKLNATISKLVSEQEKTIALRTAALTRSNEKLVELVQFNVHNLREPITRIMGLLMMRNDVNKEEFFETCLPMLEQSVNDLDNTLKEVTITSEQATK